jgi:hypothetical protein
MNGVFKNWYLVLVIGFLIQGCKSNTGEDRSLAGARIMAAASGGVSVRISSTQPVTTSSLEIPVNIEFSSPMKFQSSDMAVSGGILMGCTGSGSKYSCTLIPKSKNVSLQLVSGTLRSDKGTPNSSSNVLSFVVAAADPVYGLCIKASDFHDKFKTLRF